jgi:curved DNA-binding protein CbpA
MNNDSFKDYYKILQVDRNAAQEVITVAYKSLAKKYHPDLNLNNLEANEKMKTINEAYNVLNNAESRRKYNLTYDSYRKNDINNSSINNTYNSYMTRKESKEDIKKQSREYTKKENIKIEGFLKFKKRNIVITSIIAILFICMIAGKILIGSDYALTGKVQKDINTDIKQTDRMRDDFDSNRLNNSDNYSGRPVRKGSSYHDTQINDMPK